MRKIRGNRALLCAAVAGIGACEAESPQDLAPCSDVEAASVCYSDEYGGATADNVQEAVDDLAVRAVPDEPLASRIYFVGGPTPATAGGNMAAGCREGDILLGGTCLYVEPEPRDPDRQPIMLTHGNADYTGMAWRCEYMFPNPPEPSLDRVIIVRATCLRMFSRSPGEIP